MPIGLWIHNHFKKKNIALAKRLAPNMTMNELLNSGKEAEKLREGIAEVFLAEICKRILVNKENGA